MATAQHSASPRSGLSSTRLWVIKIGSWALRSDETRFLAVARQVATLRDRGLQVVLVSSGAVSLGMERLRLDKRPTATDRLQAVAALGQSLLMRRWETAFEPFGIPVAQMLLTHEDLEHRRRFLRARHAVEAAMEFGAVPIINENDTVSVRELGFGDNDQLAAMVSTLVGADVLLLLSTVEGVLTEEGVRVPVLNPGQEVKPRGDGGQPGLGGIGSKVQAARAAARGGVAAIIADARGDDTAIAVFAEQDVGTLVPPEGRPLENRKHWIAYTLRPKGDVLIDPGAVGALRDGRSLLAAGIVAVRGAFEAGDAVRILDAGSLDEVARGLTGYTVAEVARVAGLQSTEIEAVLGRAGREEIVHRNDLVLRDHHPCASAPPGSSVPSKKP